MEPITFWNHLRLTGKTFKPSTIKLLIPTKEANFMTALQIAPKTIRKKISFELYPWKIKMTQSSLTTLLYHHPPHQQQFIWRKVCISGLPWWLNWYKICLQCRRPVFYLGVGKIPWRWDLTIFNGPPKLQ